jgi:hypothetical protein
VGVTAFTPGGGYALVDVGWAHAAKMLKVKSKAKIVFLFIFPQFPFHNVTKYNNDMFQIR